MLFPFGCAKVRRVVLREPFLQFRPGLGVGRVIGEVIPLKWIGFNVVEFLATVAVMDVMKIA